MSTKPLLVICIPTTIVPFYNNFERTNNFLKGKKIRNMLKKRKQTRLVFVCALVSMMLFRVAGAQNKGAMKPLDTLVIEKVMGIKGKSNKGEYKITIPQNDLDVKVDGFKIIPAMGLGTWI